MVEKKLGAEQNCGSCGTHLTCNETTYQGVTKLQWQTDDGKAHFKFDVANQKSYCPNKTSSITTVEPISVKDMDSKADNEPTYEALMALASAYIPQEKIDEEVKSIHVSIGYALVKKAEIDKAMDAIGIHHPGRVAFTDMVLRRQ